MTITAVARIFLISFFIIFCLAFPVQAESASTQHIAAYSLGQVTANNAGINAYRRNLDRLRSYQAEASQPDKTQPQRQAKSTEQQQKFSFKKVFQKNSSQKNSSQEIPPAAEKQSKQDPTQIIKEVSASPQRISQQMNAYEIVEAARQPYNEQEGTVFSPASFLKIAPSQLSEHLSERASKIHNSIRQQPERLNKTVVEPLQEKITAIKEQAKTTAKATLKEQIESRGLTGRELIEGSGVSDRIHQTKKDLKASMVGILKHVETKAHETAEQLNDTAR